MTLLRVARLALGPHNAHATQKMQDKLRRGGSCVRGRTGIVAHRGRRRCFTASAGFAPFGSAPLNLRGLADARRARLAQQFQCKPVLALCGQGPGELSAELRARTVDLQFRRQAL